MEGDAPGKRTDLQRGVNIELDETGKPYRRLGTTALNSVASHSLWANDELAYVVRSGSLCQINPDLSITSLSIPIAGNRVRYQRVANDVFFTDNLTTGVVGTNGYRPWGITPPPVPAAVSINGALRAGSYLFTVTYLRASGQESGASPLAFMALPANRGIQLTVTASSDTTVAGFNIYMSDCNGEVAYLVGTYPATDSVCSITALPESRSIPVRTLRCGPPPAGQVLCLYRGVLYVASGRYLFYTQPFEYELMNRMTDFISFTAPIKTLVAVADGIFVGTEDEILFIQGNDPSQFVSVPKASYGSIYGTEATVPGYMFGDGEAGILVPIWMSMNGVCVGFDGGQFKNLTGGRYILPKDVATGASLLKIRGESPHLVTTLFT